MDRDQAGVARLRHRVLGDVPALRRRLRLVAGRPAAARAGRDLVRAFTRITAEHPADDEDEGLDPQLGELLDAQVLDSSPAWRRIVAMLPEQGWVGWSDLHPADPPSL